MVRVIWVMVIMWIKLKKVVSLVKWCVYQNDSIGTQHGKLWQFKVAGKICFCKPCIALNQINMSMMTLTNYYVL